MRSVQKMDAERAVSVLGSAVIAMSRAVERLAGR
jgi:hypothetical protein